MFVFWVTTLLGIAGLLIALRVTETLGAPSASLKPLPPPAAPSCCHRLDLSSDSSRRP